MQSLVKVALAVSCLMGPGLAQAQAAEVSAAELFGGGAQVAAEELAGIAGRADTAMTIRAQNTGSVSNTSINGPSQTGTINIDGTSFANLNGLSLLSANTGNNVAINSSMNVNVAIQR